MKIILKLNYFLSVNFLLTTFSNCGKCIKATGITSKLFPERSIVFKFSNLLHGKSGSSFNCFPVKSISFISKGSACQSKTAFLRKAVFPSLAATPT